MRFLYYAGSFIKFFSLKRPLPSVTELAGIMEINFLYPLPLLSSSSFALYHLIRELSTRRILRWKNCPRLGLFVVTVPLFVSRLPCIHFYLFPARKPLSFSPSILSTSLSWQKLLRQSPKETQVMPGLCKRHSGETRICSDAFKLFSWQTIVSISP